MYLRWLSIGALLLTLWPSSATAQETCRDAFIEGWFLETAEGDLEAALRHYRKAVELGGAEDRPVMAKAALRMARIAKARGDREAWQAQLEQIAQLYPGTEAAREAAQELARPDEAEDGSASVVDEARRDLIEMLHAAQQVATLKVRRVFRTLGVDGVMAIHQEEGGSLDSMPACLLENEFQDILVELLIQVRGLSTEALVLTHLRALRESRIPQRLRDHLPKVSDRLHDSVMHLLLTRTDPQGLLIFADLVSMDESYFEFGLLVSSVSSALLEDSRPESRTAMDAALNVILKAVGEHRYGGLPDPQRLCGRTPSADQFRKRVSEFPPLFRQSVARSLHQVGSDSLGRRELLGMLSGDPEPEVRLATIGVLLVSDDPAERETGIQSLLAEPGPVDPGLIESWLGRGSDPVPMEEVLLLPPGDLREYGYTLLLKDRRRSPADVVRYGLERGDPELITALFLPPYWQSSRLSIRGKVASNHSHPNPLNAMKDALREGLESASDQDIGRRLTEAVATHANEAVRFNFLNTLLDAAEFDRAFQRAADRLARDPSARIRLQLLQIYSFQQLGPETRVSLLLDSDPWVAERALNDCDDGAALATAAASAGEDRLVRFAGKALTLKSLEAVRACYDRLPSESALTLACLDFLAEREIGVVVEALGRAKVHPSTLTSRAQLILRRLPLPEPLLTAVRSEFTDEVRLQELRTLLLGNRAVVEESFRLHRIDQLVEFIPRFKGGQTVWREMGTRLARFDAEEELVALVRSGSRKGIAIGSQGLVALGRGKRLMQLMAETPFPEQLVDAALATNQVAALMELAKQGRITAEKIAEQAARSQRADVLASLVAPPGDWPRRLSVVNSEQLSLAIDFLVAERAVDRLEHVVRLYEAPAAVRALVQLHAFEQVLGGLTHWSGDSARTATAVLYRLTGSPETAADRFPDWPIYLQDQQQLIERWRAALLP